MPSKPVVEAVCLRVPLPVAVTDEELIKINDRNPGWKIERGVHDELEARLVGVGIVPCIDAELGAQIGNWRANGGGGRARGTSAAYNLIDGEGNTRTRSPSCSWISPERYQATPKANLSRTGFYTLCPDFAIEVSSPYDAPSRQHRRMEEWLHFGARLGWLVDPIQQRVWIYRPGHPAERLNRPATLSGEDVLEGLEVDMSEVWAFVDEDNE